MIAAKDFKRGAVITLEGAHWVVEDYHTQKTAQRRPVLHVKLRHMKTGHVVERAFDEADKFEQPDLQSRTHQFLYADGLDYVFMDAETFEQVTLSGDMVGDKILYMRENDTCKITSYEGKALDLELPQTVSLQVIETEPGIKGATAAAQTKPAKLETGLIVQVPSFITQGESIVVQTEDGKYLRRAKE